MSDFKPDNAAKVIIRDLKESEPVQNIGKRLTQRRDEIVDDALNRLRRDEKVASPQVNVAYVFIRWGLDPKTKQRTTILGVHSTLQGAQLALPEEFQKLTRKYPPDSPYIQNYINKAIERRTLDS